MHACPGPYLMGRLWVRERAVVVLPDGRRFDTSLPRLHAEMSLCKILMSEPTVDEWCVIVLCIEELYTYVCEWLNVTCTVKHLELSIKLEKLHINSK